MALLANNSILFVEIGLRILLIIAIACGATRVIRFGLIKLKQTLLSWREREDKERVVNEKRIKTLTGLVRSICTTVVWVIAVVMSLDQIGLDITPILAGAGILGVRWEKSRPRCNQWIFYNLRESSSCR